MHGFKEKMDSIAFDVKEIKESLRYYYFFIPKNKVYKFIAALILQ